MTKLNDTLEKKITKYSLGGIYCDKKSKYNRIILKK